MTEVEQSAISTLLLYLSAASFVSWKLCFGSAT